MRALLIGHGRMGQLVERLAPEHGVDVAGILTGASNHGGSGLTAERCRGVEVAIDFSTPAAVLENLPLLAGFGLPIVIGTTGWQTHESYLRRLAADAGIGVVAAANFSLGVALFRQLVGRAAAAFAGHPEYGAWIHELHHAAKRDAPSGTALALEAAMKGTGYERPIDMASTRAGSMPGTHTVGFDGPFDSVTLTHTARDRAAFARGALQAARWVAGRRGWFDVDDVIGWETGADPPRPA